MFALDTNILVRYIVQDDKEQAKKASSVIETLTSEAPAFIAAIVLCEINWVLQSAYKISKSERVSVIDKLVSASVFKIEHIEACLKALRLFETGAADFSDYFIQQIAKSEGFDTVLTFDRDAQKSAGFQGL